MTKEQRKIIGQVGERALKGQDYSYHVFFWAWHVLWNDA